MPDYGPGTQMFGVPSTMRERGRSAQQVDPAMGQMGALSSGGAQGAAGGFMDEATVQGLIQALKGMAEGGAATGRAFQGIAGPSGGQAAPIGPQSANRPPPAPMPSQGGPMIPPPPWLPPDWRA